MTVSQSKLTSQGSHFHVINYLSAESQVHHRPGWPRPPNELLKKTALKTQRHMTGAQLWLLFWYCVLTWNLYFSIIANWKQKDRHQSHFEVQEVYDVLIKKQEHSILFWSDDVFLLPLERGFKLCGVLQKNNLWCGKSVISKSSLCALEVKVLAY